MANGTVVYIYTTRRAAADLRSCEEVQAVPGKGLEGDRYFYCAGTYSEKTPSPDRELTLIEIENIDALKRDFGIELAPSETRRNIVTRGVSLNNLVGVEFYVGDVKVRGIRLCEPCTHLEQLTGKRVVKGLVHKGGLRAQILTAGKIRVGDTIKV